MNNLLQNIIRGVEEGDARFLTRLIPLTVVVVGLAAVYNFVVFCGLDDIQSMDNAQLARQIARGEGFTTRFIRPQAITDLRAYAAKRSLTANTPAELFPAAQFPQGVSRVLPDTYNAPGYPALLATWFYILRPHFADKISPRLEGFINSSSGKVSAIYSGDRWIPPLNLIFVILTGVLIFFMGRRLFDDRVAWLSVVAFFLTDLIWQFSLTGLSTSFLMFLVTAVIFCALEIFYVAESCFEIEEYSFGRAWIWGLLLSVFLAVACLTRLPLLILLVPLLVLLVLMPRPSWLLFAVITLITLACVLPWFWHMYQVSGNPLGSNAALLIYGSDGYKENQVFCSSSIPSYGLFRNVVQKEMSGFLWHIEHAWQLLGTNPLVLLFFASLLHAYKRRRAQMFQWLLVGIALVLIAVNNFGEAQPEADGAWNILVLLIPGMLVMGSAFFFIQLDRLNLQVWLLNNIIVITLLAVTATPLALVVTTPPTRLYAYPPYVPPLICIISDYSRQDEWVTSDMPWASAWYANHASLWLPDSMSDFVSIHDNTCPTGILFLSPVTWLKPTANLLTGEDKDWLFVATGANPPTNFPLPAHTAAPGPQYSIWSNTARWTSQ